MVQLNDRDTAVTGAEALAIVTATDLESLTALWDAQFVDCAYLTILGRLPDSDGKTYYLSRLRSGTAKISILADLRQSTEGRQRHAPVAGLDRAIERYRRANWPLVGSLFRARYRIDGDSAADRARNRIENALGKQAWLRELDLYREQTRREADARANQPVAMTIEEILQIAR